MKNRVDTGRNAPVMKPGTLLLAAFLLLLSGCAAFKAEPRLDPDSVACYRFLEKMDRLVALAGVADAGAARIVGFPHLRTTRFLASFADERPEGEAYRFWLDALRRIDAKARQIELRNLPSRQRLELQADAPEAAPAERAVVACGAKLAAADLASLERRALLLERTVAPDSYLGWQRAIGLYPMTRLAFAQAVARLHRELRQSFTLPLDKLPVMGRLVRYQPPPESSLSPAETTEILAKASRNPLGIPEPSPQGMEGLFRRFAPIFEVDTRDADDRIGAILLRPSGEAQVEAATPVVYRLPSHTRFRGRTLLQLNYLIWFAARPPASAVDIYAGRFDGLIWRVTLSPSGKPLVYDSIHPCGCYYQVFPTPGFRVVQPQDGSEPIFSPETIGPIEPDARLVIRLAPGTHFIQRIYAGRPAGGAVAYGWRDYDELRSLPIPDGRRRSLFDPQGFVPGSGRPERFLFWPMGIPSAGAMRQVGSHAIAFLGRRHFDDARLLETLLSSTASSPDE